MDSYFESYGTANDARSLKRILITASGPDHKQRGEFPAVGASSPCRAWASSTQGRSGPTTGFTSVCLRDGDGKDLLPRRRSPLSP